MQWLGSLKIHEFFQTQGRQKKEAKGLEEGAVMEKAQGEQTEEEENGTQEKQSGEESSLLPVEVTPCVEQPVSDTAGQHSSSTQASGDSSESITDQECGASLQTRNSDVATQSSQS